MKKCSCPFCGKELIRLAPFGDGIYNFWCDHCDVDINIVQNEMSESAITKNSKTTEKEND